MSTLYIVQAQPNPPGRDTGRLASATNEMLNEEWLELEAVGGDRILVGDVISHLTFSNTCAITGEDQLIHIPGGTLPSGRRLRLHTGRGTDGWVRDVMHIYLNRNWFVWNNACGDRATVRYQNQVIDTAGYTPNPPEGVLVRIRGTDRLEPVARHGYGTYGNRF